MFNLIRTPMCRDVSDGYAMPKSAYSKMTRKISRKTALHPFTVIHYILPWDERSTTGNDVGRVPHDSCQFVFSFNISRFTRQEGS